MVLPRNWRRLGMCSNHAEEALALGEKVPHGPASARFLSLARDLNIYVVIGMTGTRRRAALQHLGCFRADRVRRPLPQSAPLGPRKPGIRAGRPRFSSVRHAHWPYRHLCLL